MPTKPAAEIILDSDYAGHRLTTMRVTMHRFVLAEFNTHRVFSRNSASSRAIPVKRRIQQVLEDPAYPVEWGQNQPGMVAEKLVDDMVVNVAKDEWLQAARFATSTAGYLDGLGIHKQVVNRLLEPFSWHVVLVSSTEWDNFWKLRLAPDAQPEMRAAAQAMYDAYKASTPVERLIHVPFADNDDHIETAVARCARVSYGRELEERSYEDDVKLYNQLQQSGHWSPFEHVAKAEIVPDLWANFRGWYQLRTALERGLDWV